LEVTTPFRVQKVSMVQKRRRKITPLHTWTSMEDWRLYKKQYRSWTRSKGTIPARWSSSRIAKVADAWDNLSDRVESVAGMYRDCGAAAELKAVLTFLTYDRREALAVDSADMLDFEVMHYVQSAMKKVSSEVGGGQCTPIWGGLNGPV
jgi:hypothetical protein